MSRDSAMSLLTVAMTMALLMTMAGGKVVKRDLDSGTDGASVRGTTPIDVMMSLNDEDPQSIGNDHFVDYRMGDKVTLVCITEGYQDELLDLSWWEGDQSLHYIRQDATFARSSTTSLEELTLEDSGRSFSCRADDSTQTKTVTLRVDFSSEDGDSAEQATTQLHMVVNQEAAMSGDGLLLYSAGDTLSLVCLMQGSDVKRVSWWEGEKMLVPEEVTHRKHASSSTLILQHLATEDSGRRLSCRVDDSTMERTIQLLNSRSDIEASERTLKKSQKIIHIFGNTTVAAKAMNTQTIIAIWTGILAFVVVSLVCAKILARRTPAPRQDSSKPPSAKKRKVKQPKRASTDKGFGYSKLEPTLMGQEQKNKMFIFGRRLSESAIPAANIADTAGTHGKKATSDQAHTNPGFASYV